MRIFMASLIALASTVAMGQNAVTPTTVASGKVIASGNLPDEATKAAVLERLRNLYGDDRVVDQLVVGGVVAPANWSRYVTTMVGPNLKQVSNGQVQVNGNAIRISGEVDNEAMHQQVLSNLTTAFNSTYSVRDNLRVGGGKQQVLDQTLANRTVQFESGSAILAPAGRKVLDDMAAAILKVGKPVLDVIGNTDSSGNRQLNIALSLARASTVKSYLVARGVPAETLLVSGKGPDNPIADNTTDIGRARNRRIDFKIRTQ